MNKDKKKPINREFNKKLDQMNNLADMFKKSKGFKNRLPYVKELEIKSSDSSKTAKLKRLLKFIPVLLLALTSIAAKNAVLVEIFVSSIVNTRNPPLDDAESYRLWNIFKYILKGFLNAKKPLKSTVAILSLISLVINDIPYILSLKPGDSRNIDFNYIKQVVDAVYRFNSKIVSNENYAVREQYRENNKEAAYIVAKNASFTARELFKKVDSLQNEMDSIQAKLNDAEKLIRG